MEWYYKLGIYLGATKIIYFLLRLIFNGPKTPLSKDLSNYIIIVTGSSSGIGKQTAISLLSKGATVIFACRSQSKTLKVINSIKEDKLRKRAVFIQLDLSCLTSVENFVKEFTSSYKSLDILINNAGQFNEEYSLTINGVEQTMQCNHISVTYLTLLLLPTLQQSKGRVVSVGSEAHKMISELNMKDWEDALQNDNHDILKSQYKFYGIYNYALSKLGNNFMTKFFSMYMNKKTEIERNMHNVPFVCLHPGNVRTDIGKFPKNYFGKLLYIIMFPFKYTVFKDDLIGAQTTLHCCYLNDQDLVKGGYYADCKPSEESKIALNNELMKAYMNYTFKVIRHNKLLNFDDQLLLS